MTFTSLNVRRVVIFKKVANEVVTAVVKTLEVD